MKYKNDEIVKELSQYFDSIKDTEPLSREEERELAKKIQEEGCIESRNKLVTANLKFVVSVAKSYRWSGVPFSELIAEGNLGLVRAAEKYDGREGVKFISYANWWIRVYIQDCIEKYKSTLNSCEVEEYIVNNITDGDVGTCKDDNLVNLNYENELHEVQSRESSIDELLNILQQREIDILKMYFGFYDGEMTLTEIGEVLNISSERVRKIKEDALIKLRSSVLVNDEFDVIKTLF